MLPPWVELDGVGALARFDVAGADYKLSLYVTETFL
jgi:hypothetical protein